MNKDEYLLYDKTVLMSFSHGGHRYRVSFKQGEGWTKTRPTTGVTTIQNVMSKPALIGWAAKMASEKYAKELKERVRAKEEITVALANELVSVAKNAHNEARDSAGDIGTAIHEAIEAFHSDTKLDIELKDGQEIVDKAVEGYIEDWKKLGNKRLMTEQLIYSKQFDYAGTLDYVNETPSGKKVLGDLKTTKVSKWAPEGVYIENFAQLGGYAQALNEMFGWLPDILEITNVGKDGVIRKVTNEDFGMTVDDALHYWNAVYTAWYTNKDWNWKFKQ